MKENMILQNIIAVDDETLFPAKLVCLPVNSMKASAPFNYGRLVIMMIESPK